MPLGVPAWSSPGGAESDVLPLPSTVLQGTARPQGLAKTKIRTLQVFQRQVNLLKIGSQMRRRRLVLSVVLFLVCRRLGKWNRWKQRGGQWRLQRRRKVAWPLWCRAFRICENTKILKMVKHIICPSVYSQTHIKVCISRLNKDSECCHQTSQMSWCV